MKLKIFIASIISVLLNPFLVLTLTLIFGNLTRSDTLFGPALFLLILVVLLPFVIYTYFISRDKKSFFKFHNLTRVRRDLVYLFGIFTSFLTTILFLHLGLVYWFNNSLVLFILGSSMYLINKYLDKISVHSSVLSFCIIYLIDKVSIYLIFLMLLIPLVYWSRRTLHQHTLLQLFMGTIVGLLIGLLTWSF